MPASTEAFIPNAQNLGLEEDPLNRATDGLPIDSSHIEAVVDYGHQDWRVREGLRQLYGFDPDTHKHVVRVGAVARHLGEISGLDEREMQALTMGAILHDLGKTAVSSNVINSPSRLTDTEKKALDLHPETGFVIASNLLRDEEDPELRTMVPMLVLTHHCHAEDRTKYPNDEALYRLEEEGLLRVADLDDLVLERLAKLLALSDVYEAVTAQRSYTKGAGFENPNRVEEVLAKSHPLMKRSVAALMDLHVKRFPPDGWMTDVELLPKAS